MLTGQITLHSNIFIAYKLGGVQDHKGEDIFSLYFFLKKGQAMDLFQGH